MTKYHDHIQLEGEKGLFHTEDYSPLLREISVGAHGRDLGTGCGALGQRL